MDDFGDGLVKIATDLIKAVRSFRLSVFRDLARRDGA
jgi:hypothetical protein